MPALYREADIVVDQVSGIADYGVAACEAMAAAAHRPAMSRRMSVSRFDSEGSRTADH
jgi:hypothetical protein